MKTIFTMTKHASDPKHSTRFEFEKFDPSATNGLPELGEKFRSITIYIPKPLASQSKRIKVTIEEM